MSQPQEAAIPGRMHVEGARYDPSEFFGVQPISTQDLPDPALLIENLARRVLEVLASARDLDRLARWVTDDV